MTPGSLRSLTADLDEKPHATDQVLDEGIGEVTHVRQQAALDGPQRGCPWLCRRLVEQRSRRDAEPGGDPRHEIRRGDEPPALDTAHGLGGHIHLRGELLLRQAGVVAEGSYASPDPRLFLGSGHAESLGDGEITNQDASGHVIRLDQQRIPGGSWFRAMLDFTPRAAVLTFAIVLAVGCDKKPDPPPPENVAAAKPKATAVVAPSAAPSATTPAVDPAAIERTTKALNDHPPVSVPYAWEKRVLAHLRGEAGGDACPTPPKKAANEFEKPGESPCKPDNDKAASYFAACPTTVNLVVTVSKYDFGKKRFTLSDRASDPALVTKSGKTWFTSGFQLDFPTALPAFKIDGTPTSMCETGGLAETERAMSRLSIPLPLEEAKAKALREKVDATLKANVGTDTRIQVAYVLDGKTGADAGVCGTKPAKPIPTGRVVAWRLLVPTTPTITPLTDWIITSPWEWSTTCDEAVTFFGGGKVAPPASASGSAGPKAPAGKKSCEERCGDECMKEAPSMFAQCHGQCTMAKCGK